MKPGVKKGLLSLELGLDEKFCLLTQILGTKVGHLDLNCEENIHDEAKTSIPASMWTGISHNQYDMNVLSLETHIKFGPETIYPLDMAGVISISYHRNISQLKHIKGPPHKTISHLKTANFASKSMRNNQQIH